MPSAVFDYAAWVLAYPELAPSIDQATAERYFVLAETLFANDDRSPVIDLPTRLTYLDMLVAHLAKMYSVIDGESPSGIVGRITEAQEGSVRVKAADIAGNSANAAFFLSTPYGFLFWTATAYLRQGLYVADCQPNFEPLSGLPGRGFYGY